MTNSTKQRGQDAVVALGLTLLTMVFGWLWSGGQRTVGHDPFFYLSYAKDFTEAWPRYLGTSWPFGYPFAAAMLARLGVPIYVAMLFVSYAAYAVLYYLFLRGARQAGLARPRTLLVLGTLAVSPVVTLMGVCLMSEPLFGMLFFAFAFTLAMPVSWPAAIGAGLLANAAFTVRYSGILLFGIFGLYSAIRFLVGANSERVVRSTAGILSTVVLALLCYANYRHWGAISGPQPVGENAGAGLLGSFSEFGLSLLGCFSATTLVDRFADLGAVPVVFGTAAVTSVAAVCVAVMAKRGLWSLPGTVAFTTLLYVLGLVAMRLTTKFDLFAPRMALPVIFGMGFCLVALFPKWRLIPVGAIVSILISSILAFRGMSEAVRPELSEVLPYLREHLRAGDKVTVSPDARVVSSYFPNPFAVQFPPPRHPADEQLFSTRLTVLAFSATKRGNQFEEDQQWWLGKLDEAVWSGKAKVVFRGPQTLIVERVSPEGSE